MCKVDDENLIETCDGVDILVKDGILRRGWETCLENRKSTSYLSLRLKDNWIRFNFCPFMGIILPTIREPKEDSNV